MGYRHRKSLRGIRRRAERKCRRQSTLGRDDPHLGRGQSGSPEPDAQPGLALNLGKDFGVGDEIPDRVLEISAIEYLRRDETIRTKQSQHGGCRGVAGGGINVVSPATYVGRAL